MRVLHLVAMLAIAGTVNAQHTTITGPGSPIPTSGTGGGTTYPMLPAFPGTSVATAPSDVTSVTSIEVEGLTHSWIGDLQMVLCDPNGVGHLIFLRPGYLNTGAAGNSGDFAGDYVFVESGGMDLPTTSTTSTNPPPGTYNQTFSSGGVMWVDGDQMIFNTPMGSITGPAGDWTLKFYDWAAGDIGAFVSWTLNYRGDTGPGTKQCFGNTAGIGCPCMNNNDGSGPRGGEAGCANSNSPGGCHLDATGSNSIAADDLVFCFQGAISNQPGLLFCAENRIEQTFGDGIRCCGGNVIRVEIVVPDATRSGCTTDSIAQKTGAQPGEDHCYQFWYRDPNGPCGSTYNLSNAYKITWTP